MMETQLTLAEAGRETNSLTGPKMGWMDDQTQERQELLDLSTRGIGTEAKPSLSISHLCFSHTGLPPPPPPQASS